MQDAKLLELLDVVIDHYISKWDPVGSKFLNSLDDVDYAPSTLRKYLNLLEKAWLVYQPYNSSGRIPTLEGFETYVSHFLEESNESKELVYNTEIKKARNWLKYLVETTWQVADGVVVGFLRNDEYYYLGINNLLREDLIDQYETTRHIVRFIENKNIIKLLDTKMIKRWQAYHTFIQDKWTVISCIYSKVVVDDYDSILSIIWPTRVDYKKNIRIMQDVITSLGK